MKTNIWKQKQNELVLSVKILRQLDFASELMKRMYNKRQEQHKNQINIMGSKLFELLPYTKAAQSQSVTQDNIFSMTDQVDKQIIQDLHKK